LVIWSHPGNDVTGMLARSEKVAGTCEKVSTFVALLLLILCPWCSFLVDVRVLLRLFHIIM